jgi:EAL domain-containing protein (putative c-di-GMP-specific phosphodiesterase class I)
MQDAIVARAKLEDDLHKALEERQFQLYYQVQTDNDHNPVGVEALVRWIHPERGLIAPIEFIPIAEETELILLLGKWVIETACMQLKAWQKDSLARDLILSVNVSAKQFRQADFASLVESLMTRYSIGPDLLTLELTEGIVLENIEDTIATMNALKKAGVRLSLDDFGTGYSSLQYLKQLPISQVKIDRSFVRDIAVNKSDEAIVKTIITLAANLDLNVVAEGVEREDQKQFLLNNGCKGYQGYLFGEPLPIDRFMALLKSGADHVCA